jgi:hypothetical protein
MMVEGAPVVVVVVVAAAALMRMTSKGAVVG